MSSQDNVAQAYRVPLSGTIVGVLVREFQLNSPGLNTKTAKRYFRGQRVKDASRFEVIEAVADVLVKEGFVPRLPFLDNQGWPVDKLLTLAMVGYAKRWDELANHSCFSLTIAIPNLVVRWRPLPPLKVTCFD